MATQVDLATQGIIIPQIQQQVLTNRQNEVAKMQKNPGNVDLVGFLGYEATFCKADALVTELARLLFHGLH